MENTSPLRREPLWHIELAVLFAIVVQLFLTNDLTIGPKYLLAGLELLLLITLRLTAPVKHTAANHVRRVAGLLLTGLVSLTNIASLILVCNSLLNGTQTNGKQLIISAMAIYLTNIIIFGLWYWQLDGGGHAGRGTHKPPIDFLFPQKTVPEHVTMEPNWQPSFMDYLFVSITCGTAFSPTDAMPLTHRAKFLMSIQALVSLSTVALVAARAINILT